MSNYGFNSWLNERGRWFVLYRENFGLVRMNLRLRNNGFVLVFLRSRDKTFCATTTLYRKAFYKIECKRRGIGSIKWVQKIQHAYILKKKGRLVEAGAMAWLIERVL